MPTDQISPTSAHPDLPAARDKKAQINIWMPAEMAELIKAYASSKRWKAGPASLAILERAFEELPDLRAFADEFEAAAEEEAL